MHELPATFEVNSCLTLLAPSTPGTTFWGATSSSARPPTQVRSNRRLLSSRQDLHSKYYSSSQRPKVPNTDSYAARQCVRRSNALRQPSPNQVGNFFTKRREHDASLGNPLTTTSEQCVSPLSSHGTCVNFAPTAHACVRDSQSFQGVSVAQRRDPCGANAATLCTLGRCKELCYVLVSQGGREAARLWSGADVV